MLYFFIALSVILIIGYYRGFRINRKISRNVLDALLKTLEASDQTITNIGGNIGYHFSITPSKDSLFTLVRATVTFLPRHALLYYPFSKLIRKYDRMFIIFESDKFARSPQAGFIETSFKKYTGKKLINNEHFSEKFSDNDIEYQFYAEDKDSRGFIEKLMKNAPEKPLIKQIEINPGEKNASVFMIPEPRHFESQIRFLTEELTNYLKNMSTEENFS